MPRFPSLLPRLIGKTIETIIVVIVVGGLALFLLVLAFEFLVRVNSCPDGEHMGPGGFPAPVCEDDEPKSTGKR